MTAKAEPKPLWRNRIVGEGEADPETLMPNPFNWRQHPALQRAALAGVLNEIGWVQRVVVNRTTGHIIDGHLRVEMARGKGEKVPYVEVELTEDEEAMVLATLDPLTGLATTDQEALSALLSKLSPADGAVADLLAKLGGDTLTAESLVGDTGEGDELAIGFEISVIVVSPADRDRASEAITKMGLTPRVRTIRNLPEG